MRLTPEAVAQVEALERFYIQKQRPQALRNLGHALAEASLMIMNAPDAVCRRLDRIPVWRA